MSLRREFRRREVPESEDIEVRDDMLRTLMGLGTTIVRSRGRFTEPQIIDNNLWFCAGEHGGFTQKKSGTLVKGAPGAVVRGPVEVTLASEYHGLRFASTVTVASIRDVVFVDCDFELGLTVPAGAVVRFVRCSFGTGAPSIAATGTGVFDGCYFSELLQVAATGYVHCIGCVFDGNAAINNAGVLGNAYVIGCSRKSGVAHVNTTTIAETT